MKGRGWTLVRPSTVWAGQARDLALQRTLHGSPLRCSGDQLVQDRLQLLEHLEHHNVPQGVGALLGALCFRCSSVEDAYACLGGSGSGISMLAFVGGLSLLGLDAAALCGCREQLALQQLDVDGDGRISRSDMVLSKSQSACQLDDGNRNGSISALVVADSEYSLAVGKFIALSAWFCTPPPLRRRGRIGRPLRAHGKSQKQGHGQKEEAEEETDAATPPSPLPSRRGTAPCSPSQRVGESSALAKQQALDALRLHWAPQEDDYEAVNLWVLSLFSEQATNRQHDEKLLSRADVLELLDDSPLACLCNETMSGGRIARAMVCAIYDEVLAFQADRRSSTLRQTCLTKGLTFESFRMVLLKVALAVGLHFRHLVDDAIDALMGLCTFKG